jgi:hypothetical protein
MKNSSSIFDVLWLVVVVFSFFVSKKVDSYDPTFFVLNSYVLVHIVSKAIETLGVRKDEK